MELLHGPTRSYQITGQPIEQFGMGGSDTIHSKVVGCRYQPNSEVTLPNAIGDHACGERVFRRCNPIGQRDAPFLFRSVLSERYRT